MSGKQIFLSHIHEERELAILIKTSLEDEFGGFVNVFVSSDGVNIPAGANFLKRIEDGLIDCVGAIYLISPLSVKRNWINFELGAVWVRSAMSVRAGKEELPTLPMCHSGMTRSALPPPLNNLNAIDANQRSQLSFAFRSLQAAVGGKGALRTDFDRLANEIAGLESIYTLGRHLETLLRIITPNRAGVAKVIEHCQENSGIITLKLGFIENDVVKQLQDLETKELNGKIEVHITNPGTSFGTSVRNGAEVSIALESELILRFKDALLTEWQD